MLDKKENVFYAFHSFGSIQVHIAEAQLKVTKVETIGNDVFVHFDDSHRARFVPYFDNPPGGSVEGLRHLFLYRGEELVCQFDGRLHHAGPMPDECRIAKAADGYTPQRIAEYWQHAKTHVNEEYFEKPQRTGKEGSRELWFPWVVTSAGWIELGVLQEGRSAPFAK